MKRIPKQEYTAKLKEQSVKRADEVGSIARTAEELGLVEQRLRNWVKAAKAGKLNPVMARPLYLTALCASLFLAFSVLGIL